MAASKSGSTATSKALDAYLAGLRARLEALEDKPG